MSNTTKQNKRLVPDRANDRNGSQPSFRIETVRVADLKPHPRNYREHPPDQIEHLAESIAEHGVYRNIVISRDGYILAGHGVVQACRTRGLEQVPVYRVDLAHDDVRAMKLLVGDNEIDHLAEMNDRMLTEMLKDIKEYDPAGLVGTGFDEMMLANLVFVTRPESEIADINEAAHWAGMPEYDAGTAPFKVVVSFRDEKDKADFARRLGLRLGAAKVSSTWWPVREQEDAASVKYEAEPA